MFTDAKTLQILPDCGQNISWKSTINHIWWSVRHSGWLLSTFLFQRSFPGTVLWIILCFLFFCFDTV